MIWSLQETFKPGLSDCHLTARVFPSGGGCVWNSGSRGNCEATGQAGWPDAGLCQLLWLAEDPQTKPPASITQLTAHLGRHTQACLTSNVNMAKHEAAVGPNS